MDNKKIRHISAAILVCLWGVLTLFAWFGPAKDISESERRPLAQFPELTLESIFSTQAMQDFEDYTLDQFPLRDTFRQLKSLFHFYVLNQGDNNGIYIADGYAVKMEYPYNQSSVNFAVNRFNRVYDTLLKGRITKAYFAVVPDKGYYLGQSSGHLTMDYAAMNADLQAGLPWATFIDLTDSLSAKDYYFTDTHWRQEQLLPAAQTIAQAMGKPGPKAEDYTVTQLDRPFYGVYYGQAALPMEAEPMYLLESPLLDGCTVLNHETGERTKIYDMSKLASKDLYDVYLSGAQALLTITNPAAKTNKELVVFRDSFGSAIIPLLVQDYRTVTVVDIRYIAPEILNRYVQFRGQEVLFLYSTLVLNNSATLK